MNDHDERLESSLELRRAAERRAALAPEALTAMSPAEVARSVHELQVHQIELEMQNEALRQARQEGDALQARYFDLYELAPAGYCTLSDAGLLLAANLTFATLLGATRSALLGQPISRFLFKEDQDLYYRNRRLLAQGGKAQAYDLRMVKNDGAPVWVHIEAALAQDESGRPVCRMILSDITSRRQAEEAMSQKFAEVERINNVIVGRELRMIELKEEVNALLTAAGQPAKYVIV